MAMILSGIVVAIAIAFGASYFLTAEQETAWMVNSSSATRVGDPGENLVGPDWSGQARPGEANATQG